MMTRLFEVHDWGTRVPGMMTRLSNIPTGRIFNAADAMTTSHWASIDLGQRFVQVEKVLELRTKRDLEIASKIGWR